MNVVRMCEDARVHFLHSTQQLKHHTTNRSTKKQDANCTYIFQLQAQDPGEVGLHDAHQEGRGGRAHLQHVRGQQGDVDVLPAEGVQQRHQRVNRLRQGAGKCTNQSWHALPR